MAINFPNSPSDGDLHEGYAYDATDGVWNRVYADPLTNLNDFGDVTITTPADNEVLAYDNTSSEWINQTPAEAGIAEASHTHTISDITDISTYVADNAAPKLLLETSEQTASYTLALTDINKVVLMNVDTGTLTIPTNASVAFPIGTVVNVYNLNFNDLTIQGDSGVTVRNAGALIQYGEVSLRKRSTDEWVLLGNVS